MQPLADVAILPHAARVLHAIRSVLQSTVAPQVTDAAARQALELSLSLLGQLAAREESGAVAAAVQANRERQATLLDQLHGVLNAATRSPPQNDSSQALEQTLEAVLEKVRLDAVSQPRAARVVEATMQSEVEFLAALPVLGVDLRGSAKAAVEESASPSLDPVLDLDRIDAQLQRCFPKADVRATAVTKIAGGTSKETFLITLASGAPLSRVTLRRDIDGGPVEGTVLDEAPLFRALHAAGLPVPELLLAEADPTLLGHPFILMRHVPGSTALDAVGIQFGPHAVEHARLLARTLAQLHRLDLQHLQLQEADPRVSLREHVERNVDRFEAQWRRRRLTRSPIIIAGLAWVRQHIPDNGPAALVHGDASLRNLLVHEHRVSALLDWELWHAGDPTEDLAYCREDIEKVLPWGEFLAEYHDHGGREYREEVGRFYQTWMQLRNGIFAANLLWDFAQGGQSDSLLVPSVVFSYYVKHLQHVARNVRF